MEPAFEDAGLLTPRHDVPAVRRKFQDRRWLHAALFLATLVTTSLAGAGHYHSFITDQLQRPLTLSLGELVVRGASFGGTVILILGFHEAGHYLACRYYDVDASLPYFLPLPMPLSLAGTLGAFIRIREPIPSKRMLFDIGIAGPIAGFLLAVPALFLGAAMSTVVPAPTELPPGAVEIRFGDPLLMKLVVELMWGTPPEGQVLNLHPMTYAAWFGLLATALNLIPIGQLDGGHIAYAVLGRRSVYVTFAMLAAGMGLAFYSRTWIVWIGLIALMLMLFGPRHPRVDDEDVPLDRTRLLLAASAVVMFVLCFTPVPLEIVDVIER